MISATYTRIVAERPVKFRVFRPADWHFAKVMRGDDFSSDVQVYARWSYG